MWDSFKLIVLGVIAVFAAIAANYARDLAYQVNALTVMLAAGLAFLWVLRAMDNPDRKLALAGAPSEYLDGPVRAGVIATAFWGVVGFLVGVVIAFQLATMGSAVSRATAELFERNAYRDYLELHGLSVQLTEGLAEMWHARVRSDLGLDGADGPVEEMVRDQAYRGSRYSFGYPACPDLEDRAKLVSLLRPERIGVELSEELQLHPEQSTDALVVHHPEAKYFNAR